LARNPAGAILGYRYALLEAETILACHAVGSISLSGSSTPTAVSEPRWRSS
jgi:hypothetical protein